VNKRSILRICLLPAGVLFLAFWLLPVLQLLWLPAEQDWTLYFVVFTEWHYFESLANTLILASSVTLLTLILGASVGLFLARHHFCAKRLLLAILTLPLSFPGVIVGFFMILLGGRQGLLADITNALGMGTVTFAYGFTGLFLAYLYFSLPRAIASYAAAAQTLDMELEQAARSLGAGRWHIIRDVWIPQLAPTTSAIAAIVFATAVGAFGTAFTLSSKFEVLPITIYTEFTNFANFALAASLSITLGLCTWFVLFITRRKQSGSVTGV
jgi:putative spermidine/putrescine transport system permease protein